MVYESFFGSPSKKFIDEEERKRQRTLPQNRAIRLYWKLLAVALNEAGFTVEKVMRHDFEIPWTQELVGEILWRELQRAMFFIESTADLSTTQVSDIYHVLDHQVSMSTGGVSVDFPCLESLMKKYLGEDYER